MCLKVIFYALLNRVNLFMKVDNLIILMLKKSNWEDI